MAWTGQHVFWETDINCGAEFGLKAAGFSA